LASAGRLREGDKGGGAARPPIASMVATLFWSLRIETCYLSTFWFVDTLDLTPSSSTSRSPCIPRVNSGHCDNLCHNCGLLAVQIGTRTSWATSMGGKLSPAGALVYFPSLPTIYNSDQIRTYFFIFYVAGTGMPAICTYHTHESTLLSRGTVFADHHSLAHRSPSTHTHIDLLQSPRTQSDDSQTKRRASAYPVYQVTAGGRLLRKALAAPTQPPP
jgi:hypothetical protein